MNRLLKVLTLVFIALFVSCKKDDDSNTVPPRDYGEQYAADMDSIENYLKNNYIVSVDEDYNIEFAEITDPITQVSIWDQTDYPLMSKQAKSYNENNTVTYTLYYLLLNEGGGNAPTRGDNILVSYRGTLLNGTQFDYQPYPQGTFSLAETIEAWQELMPLFKSGDYIDIPDNPNPAEFENYGAGVMFVPSGMGYYNNPRSVLIPNYSPLVFTFKLYAVDYTDLDSDGILNKDETEPGIDIYYYDTDEDGIPNYLDTDDDGDGYTTFYEITITGTDEQYPFDEIPTCEGGTLKKHLDPNCH
ncbi:FKBP-type peptidyl-prolyl cis-trans isomerase [Flavobacterium rhizosphaerae]|uniref:Peptidyl-prolyl cis-trans isomerase n=1 Tax=Flavobacterium rhizosphaerae TaxID=3163298 RepID=A0ABW8Z2F3_9FLAO